jgi:protein subunit release factor A
LAWLKFHAPRDSAFVEWTQTQEELTGATEMFQEVISAARSLRACTLPCANARGAPQAGDDQEMREMAREEMKALEVGPRKGGCQKDKYRGGGGVAEDGEIRSLVALRSRRPRRPCACPHVCPPPAPQESITKLEEDLKMLMLPKDPLDDKNVMLEIRAGTGGDEANIWANDLVEVYTRYAKSQGWSTSMLEESDSTKIIQVQGEAVYSKLKYEAGVHRVQRVPATETQGRVHTSTATVAIMPEVDEVADPPATTSPALPPARPQSVA